MDARIRNLLETRILTTRELSELTGIPEITIQKRVERGQIECVKKGRTYLFDSADFPVHHPVAKDGQARNAPVFRRAGPDDDDAGPSRGEGR